MSSQHLWRETAYTDTAIVEESISSHIVNNTMHSRRFTLISNVRTSSMRTLKLVFLDFVKSKSFLVDMLLLVQCFGGYFNH